jgi:hypothetical protein
VLCSNAGKARAESENLFIGTIPSPAAIFNIKKTTVHKSLDKRPDKCVQTQQAGSAKKLSPNYP